VSAPARASRTIGRVLSSPILPRTRRSAARSFRSVLAARRDSTAPALSFGRACSRAVEAIAFPISSRRKQVEKGDQVFGPCQAPERPDRLQPHRGRIGAGKPHEDLFASRDAAFADRPDELESDGLRPGPGEPVKNGLVDIRPPEAPEAFAGGFLFPARGVRGPGGEERDDGAVTDPSHGLKGFDPDGGERAVRSFRHGPEDGLLGERGQGGDELNLSIFGQPGEKSGGERDRRRVERARDHIDRRLDHVRRLAPEGTQDQSLPFRTRRRDLASEGRPAEGRGRPRGQDPFKGGRGSRGIASGQEYVPAHEEGRGRPFANARRGLRDGGGQCARRLRSTDPSESFGGRAGFHPVGGPKKPLEIGDRLSATPVAEGGDDPEPRITAKGAQCPKKGPVGGRPR
jgi:hypothetical protein